LAAIGRLRSFCGLGADRSIHSGHSERTHHHNEHPRYHRPAASYQVSAGLIKGSSDDGDFVVPCTLGVLSVVSTNSSVRVGIGDCQAMRWIDGQWRISPTTAPTLAPATWPGTTEAQTAGYVAVIPDA